MREGKPLTDAMLLEEHSTLPSRLVRPIALAQLVAGDLDAIMLKAMRRDPGQRYASVERLDDGHRGATSSGGR